MQMASGIYHSILRIPEERVIFSPLPTSQIQGKDSYWSCLSHMAKPGPVLRSEGLGTMTG